VYDIQAVYAEKVMAASGATPEDIAKTLLIQTILKQRGVSSGKFATIFCIYKKLENLQTLSKFFLICIQTFTIYFPQKEGNINTGYCKLLQRS
jgi:hypothetical protein